MVIINSTQDVNGLKQWVFITIEVDGDTVEHITVQPWNNDEPLLSGDDLQDWCNSQEDRYKLEVLKDMYKGAKPKGYTLEDFEKWISAGAENEINGEKVKVIKREWKNKHPRRLKIIEDINNATINASIKNILLRIVQRIS